MRAGIMGTGALFGLIAFLLSGTVTPVAGEPGKLEQSIEQCVKGGKALPIAKTRDACTKGGGVWVKREATKMPPDPIDKRKAMPSKPIEPGRSRAIPDDPLRRSRAMPEDPLERSKARPPDPLERSKALPSAGQTAPAGVR